MRISKGATRFVILVGDKAIKIARFRPLWVVLRILKWSILGQIKRRLELHGDTASEGAVVCLRAIVGGLIANRNEACLWHHAREPWMVPTLYSFFGVINIQPRGESVTQKELDAEHPFLPLVEAVGTKCGTDVVRKDNFCRYKGRVMCVDYGSDEMFGVLYLRRSVGQIQIRHGHI